jgi:hypothetical protein
LALLDDLRREVRQRGERIARAAVTQMQGNLRADTPKVTGDLRKATTVRVVSAGNVIVAEAKAETDYAASVIAGSRPHIIRAKNPNGYLRFPGRGGVFVFRKQVQHPGTKPNPYWNNQMNRWQSYLQNAADRLR